MESSGIGSVEPLAREREEPVAAERLARLFEAHQARLYRLARRLSQDHEEARDLVQEAFLRAARNPGKVPREEPDGEAWLVRVLVNLCRDRHRRLQVRSAHTPRPAPWADPSASSVARLVVEAALAELAPRRRAVVVMAELEGLAAAEIGRLLGVASVTVRWHLLAGRRQLAQLLGAAPRKEEA